MGTIVIFSSDDESMHDVIERLQQLKKNVVWFPVREWAGHQEELRQAIRVFIDEVDDKFRALEPLMDLEDWILHDPEAPPVSFFEADDDHHLDHYPLVNPERYDVHHLGEQLTDDRLKKLSMGHARQAL